MFVYQPEIGTIYIKLIEAQAIIRQGNLNIVSIILTETYIIILLQKPRETNYNIILYEREGKIWFWFYTQINPNNGGKFHET
jgi:hypothetical protein